MEFVNLYTLSEYSLLESSNHINKLLKKAKDYKYSSLAITDVNNTSGLFKFYNKAKELNIKPILGINISIKSDYFNS
ncbi:MAG: PHP domain-containing protein, partial [Bacilli bacterium]